MVQEASVKPQSTEGILEQLTGNTQQALTRLSEEGSKKVLDEIGELDKQFEEAAKIKDEAARASRVKILTANFETVTKGLEVQQQDLSKAVLGLQGLMVAMGKEYDDLQKPTASEQAIIAGAESKLTAAKVDLAKAQQSWNIFGSRDRAIAAGEAEIKTAESEIIEANARVKQMVRDRLMNADIESSLQTFMKMVSDTIDIMQKRMASIDTQVKEVGSRKQKAFSIKEQAAKALEMLDGQLIQEEGTLQTEEEALSTYTNGSPDHAAQTTRISTLRAQVEEIRGKRNTALVLFQSKERFAKELEVHEKAQIKLRDNQRAWITLLKSDTEERVITFKSKLEAMKAKADQDVAQNLNSVGVEIDQRNAEDMAMIGAASDRVAIEMLEKQPDHIRRLNEIQAAQAEAHAKIRDRFGVVLQQFREEYGINPLDTSFFTYSEKADDAEAPK